MLQGRNWWYRRGCIYVVATDGNWVTAKFVDRLPPPLQVCGYRVESRPYIAGLMALNSRGSTVNLSGSAVIHKKLMRP